MPHDSSYLFGADHYFAFEPAYGSSEFGGAGFGAHDDASRFYASQMGLSRGNQALSPYSKAD